MSAISFLIEPDITMTSYGNFLATTPNSTPLRIGVIGINKDDAKQKFSESLERWKKISEENLSRDAGVI